MVVPQCSDAFESSYYGIKAAVSADHGCYAFVYPADDTAIKHLGAFRIATVVADIATANNILVVGIVCVDQVDAVAAVARAEIAIHTLVVAHIKKAVLVLFYYAVTEIFEYVVLEMNIIELETAELHLQERKQVVVIIEQLVRLVIHYHNALVEHIIPEV